MSMLRLIGEKMLLRSLEKIGCKCLIGVTNLCKWCVSQLNGGGYSPKSGRKHHIYFPESA
jgi:hypothetical protein